MKNTIPVDIFERSPLQGPSRGNFRSAQPVPETAAGRPLGRRPFITTMYGGISLYQYIISCFSGEIMVK
jgi:hypothetical protein